ncbi:Glycosyltransferase involved in cell wall bisynthesis [Arenibacter nanhaiticus]|uniref:Glycosyltransferase involved in cell wall bisynthesis n=1 Tax=Arenibacter nanhaiticus TaxID=558155 RepID=A0A1M6LYM5_9FLAO|nr:glycosyltransferase family 4 protein [Arenibacter nanhaiticus]SHJ76262.1 Glycosyltransferase involved in cell wall bisynthesis [Arenibacter nanhaiticus]
MEPRILYILSSFNLYGGTPKKTLDLMKHLSNRSVVYVYHNSFSEFKSKFVATGGGVYEGFYGRNIFLHIRKLLSIIDTEKINIIQTQFSIGETLGYFIKLFRPKIKLLVTFESSIKPVKLKAYIVGLIYRKIDYFVFISNYVKNEKQKQFPLLKHKRSKVIYNGTEQRIDAKNTLTYKKGVSLLSISGLIPIKNIQILIKALGVIINQHKKQDIHLYVAGDGPMRKELEILIKALQLDSYIHLLGYQENIGGLLNNCDIYVHPCYKEGFGIAVAEAMFAEKPIIVSNAGALPELVRDAVDGLVVSPHDELEWVNAILKVMENSEFANKIAYNAKKSAAQNFSIEKYTKSYEDLYIKILSN